MPHTHHWVLVGVGIAAGILIYHLYANAQGGDPVKI